MTSQTDRPSGLRNRFASIPDDTFERCIAFARQHPEIISMEQAIEKLLTLDFLNPLLDDVFTGGRILEIGCGSGLQSALLTQRGSVSATELQHTVGWLGDTIDANRKSIFNEIGGGRVDFRYNDGVTLPFADGEFDMVFHNSVIEHVPDPEHFNREAYRVLRPGGICVCVTGTPTLVRLRFLRRYLLLYPAIVGHAAASALLNRGDSAVMRRVKARSTSWHVIPPHERLQEIVDAHFAGADGPSALSARELRAMYPRLRHFVRDPLYNRIVIERLASAHGVSPRALVLQLVRHFRSRWNTFRFRLTVPTHGQHTRSYRTEMQEWRIERWVEMFARAGLHVVAVRGYRYQHLFEVTLSKRLNAWMAYQSLGLARRLARALPPWAASEFILVARKAS